MTSPLWKARIGAVLAGLVMTLVLPGQGLGQDWERIQREMASVKTVQADFVQTKNLKILSQPAVSRGRFFFTAPDYLRWEYLSPFKAVMLMRQDEVEVFRFQDGAWVREPGGSIEIRRSVLDGIKGWFQGNFGGPLRFKTEFNPPDKVVMTPRALMAGFVDRIELTLGASPGELRAVEIVEGADSSTRIDFSGVRINTFPPHSVYLEP